MTATEQVFQHIKANPGLLPSEIAAALPGVNRSTAYGAIDNLWAYGEIERLEGADGYRYFIDTARGNDATLAALETQARELEKQGLQRRAAAVWLEAFDTAQSANDRELYRQRRLRCLAGMTKGYGDDSCVAGRYVGGNDA